MQERAPLSVATVCACNINRSVECHAVLGRVGFAVKSFGAASKVKVPGPIASLAYPFGTPYESIVKDMEASPQADWFRSKNLISMMSRNAKLKRAPERWQDYFAIEEFDVVVCLEEKVYDLVVDDIMRRRFTKVHDKLLVVLNVETHDSAEAARTAASNVLAITEEFNRLRPSEKALPRISAILSKQLGMEPLCTLIPI